MCTCLHVPCSHTFRVPQPGPSFLSEVHAIADDIDVLIEEFMDKICRATGQSREELQRELEMVELEEDPQLDSVSDATITITITITTTTAAAAEEQDLSDFDIPRKDQLEDVITQKGPSTHIPFNDILCTILLCKYQDILTCSLISQNLSFLKIRLP